MLGYLLLCVYGCLRCSDAERVVAISDETHVDSDGLEKGCVEAKALSTKTARTAELQRKFFLWWCL